MNAEDKNAKFGLYALRALGKLYHDHPIPADISCLWLQGPGFDEDGPTAHEDCELASSALRWLRDSKIVFARIVGGHVTSVSYETCLTIAARKKLEATDADGFNRSLGQLAADIASGSVPDPDGQLTKLILQRVMPESG